MTPILPLAIIVAKSPRILVLFLGRCKTEMNARERYLAVMNFEEVDRTLLWEFAYWASAVRRWYKEGLPKVKGIPEDVPDGWSMFAECGGTPIGRPTDEDVHNYFGMDPAIVRVPLKIGAYPPYEEKIIEDHGDWYIWQDGEGCLRRDRKDKGSVPAYIGWPVKNRQDWERYKEERLQPSLEGRLPGNWPQLVEEYKNRDYPLALGQLGGFFGTPRWLLGAEELLIKYYDDPELMKDINNYLADFWIALFDGVLSQVQADAMFIWEDMAYKKGPLISPAMFREFILPGYKKLTGFLKDHGVNIINVDSDGNIWKLIPLWIEGGVTVLYPFEVEAGMDIVEVRKAFPRLGIMGGLEKKVITEGKEAIDRELEAKVPFMLQHGGYVPCADHSVQPGASFENYAYYRRRLEQMIRGDKKA
ncbi:uroporphyrinogen decarboxylase family protein [Chloroflexota bacterium]